MSDNPQVVTEEEAQAWVDWKAPDCVVGENPRALRVAFLHGFRAGRRTPPAAAPVEPQAVERAALAERRYWSGTDVCSICGKMVKDDEDYERDHLGLRHVGRSTCTPAALASVPAPPGFVTVPVLTEAMERAGFDAIEEYQRWKAERKFPRPSLIAHVWDQMTKAAG